MNKSLFGLLNWIIEVEMKEGQEFGLVDWMFEKNEQEFGLLNWIIES